jgi:hypothetical protein
MTFIFVFTCRKACSAKLLENDIDLSKANAKTSALCFWKNSKRSRDSVLEGLPLLLFYFGAGSFFNASEIILSN